MRSAVALLSPVGCLALLASSLSAAEVLSFNDFEVSPTPAWHLPAGATWTSEASYSGTRSLKSTTTEWIIGPSDPAPPVLSQYYHFSAYTRASVPNAMFASAPVPVSGDSWAYVESLRSYYSSPYFAGVGPSSPVYLDDVRLTKVSHAEARALADAHWDRVHGGGSFAMPVDRHEQLTGTIGKLKAGQPLKMVLLGDSIVSDISGGVLEPLMERHYPGAHVTMDKTVRGSTGCWDYKDEVESAVLSKNPDLVVIGGISHRDDIESIRSVIDQVQEAAGNIEVLLLTEIAGSTDPNDPADRGAFDPQGNDWRARLYRLSVEEEVGFLDMTPHWAGYIFDSGKGREYFMRDAIHNNNYGSELAGRIVDAFFAPVPEPSCLGLLVLGAATAMRRHRRS
jgi:hypothetical protein